MTEKEMLEELTLKLERLEAQEACRNLMGKYSYYHTAFRNKEYIDLWARRDDDLLSMPWGDYHGFEGVKACYMNDHGDRNDPATFESLKGAVMMHTMNTEIIEVAADGQTAKAAFFSDGHETYIEGRVPGFQDPNATLEAHAEWCWGAYAVDFIKDKGEWKIWHMRLYPINKSEYGESWVDAVQPTPDDYTFMSSDRSSRMWHYSPTEVYPENQPAIPWPYEKFEDVGITFLDKED